MEPIEKRTTAKGSVIALLVLLITFLYYQIDHHDIDNRILLRELYFLPIILAGSRFGLKGGLSTSVFITFLYLYFVLTQPSSAICHTSGNIMQIMFYNLFGLVFGLLGDRQKRQQQKLLDAESLAAMGKAVSCISHDMKTPLVAIGALINQVRRKVVDEKLAKKLEIAFGQIQWLELLVGDMLTFAKPLTLECRKGMINHLIEEVVMISGEKALRHSVTIATELQEDMPVAEFDRHRLRQALINLINNALEASPQGSEVVFRSKSDDACIFIEVVDRGVGIPRERLRDIFTPFVTSKNEGTGLGLAIVQKVVEAHEGVIHLIENSKKGATFRITIPLKHSGGLSGET